MLGSRSEETSEIARSRRLTETTASDCPAIFRMSPLTKRLAQTEK